MNTALTNDTEDLAGLTGLYGLLAQLWMREPNLALIRQLCSAPLRDNYRAAGGSVPQNADQATVDLLAADYCRIFVGPSDHFPPCQSVWEEGKFEGRATASMRRFADIAGVEVPERMMPDHLGFQLLVMSRLTGQLSQASGQQADTLFELSKTFFRNHLAWASPILIGAAERAETSFYASMIRLTCDFLTSELSVQWT